MGILISLFLMVLFPFSWLFLFTLTLGMILAISSDSWFGAWCGLELNLLSFIPFISTEKNLYTSEASLKYFLIQALGSAFIVFGASLIRILPRAVILIVLALILKLGAAPFHFWFPQVIDGLFWKQALVLITIQKIAPIYLLSHTLRRIWIRKSIVILSAIFSAIVGGIGGINQILLRKLLAYSSINHISWMLFAIMIGENSWVLYFIFYALISSSVVILFFSCQIYHFIQLVNFNKPSLRLVRFLSLLSLGGLPPFSGFLPKWILIQEMVIEKLWFSILVLLLRSLLTLYYYLRVSLMHLRVMTIKLKWTLKFFFLEKNNLFIITVNFLGLFLPSVYILI